MRPCLSLLALTTLLIAAPALAGGTSPAEELWDDYLTALGGFDALRAVETRIVHGRYLEELSWKDPGESSVAISVYYWNWEMTTVLSFQTGSTLHEFYDGNTRWVKKPDGWIREEGGDLQPRLWADPLLLPSADAICETWQLKPATPASESHVLEGLDADGGMHIAEFDADSGLLRRLDRWAFEEYRKVGDVLMPARIVESRKGGQSAWQVDQVEQNVQLPSELFGW